MAYIAYYRINDGAGGNVLSNCGGTTGTMVNGSVWVIGKTGTCGSFAGDAGSRHINCGSTMGIISGLTGWTMRAMIKFGTVGTVNNILAKSSVA
jgi:hypothetical protein